MLQPFNPYKVYEKKPDRELAIQKDEVISLKIDLEVLSPEQLYDKYFLLEKSR